MSSQAIAPIDAVTPYKGGNDVLWQSIELNNVDKHRLMLTVGSAVPSADFGDYFRQLATPGLILSKAEGFSFFLGTSENEYPLKVGTVVFSDQTTTEIKNPKIRFEVVIYEKNVIEGNSLHETLQNMISAVDKIITDFQPLLVQIARSHYIEQLT